MKGASGNSISRVKRTDVNESRQCWIVATELALSIHQMSDTWSCQFLAEKPYLHTAGLKVRRRLKDTDRVDMGEEHFEVVAKGLHVLVEELDVSAVHGAFPQQFPPRQKVEFKQELINLPFTRELEDRR